jgi:Uma2 family endonuclease
MATRPDDLKLSLAEFLDWNDGTDTRYELIDGQVVAMAPPSPRPSVLAGRLARLIGAGLRPPCEVFIEAGIVTPDRPDTHLQADLAVSCRPPGQQERAVAEPSLVVEVVSLSTLHHDRGVKVDRYRELGSVQEILLVASDERRVQLWRRERGRWSVEDVIGDARRSGSTACRSRFRSPTSTPGYERAAPGLDGPEPTSRFLRVDRDWTAPDSQALEREKNQP